MILPMGHAKIVGEAEAQQRLNALPGWSLEKASIRKQFTFGGFPDAMAFVVRLGFDAEAADHHPDMLVNYKRVTLTYTTHSEGGLTEKDFAGAARASVLAGSANG
jgi:4a-hydroxytetrahydrobiopterin dehydratase